MARLFEYRGPKVGKNARVWKGLEPRGPAEWDSPVIRDIAQSVDPAAYLRWAWSPSGLEGTLPRTMPLGVSVNSKWAPTKPDTHVLALGPPRSAAGKTASVMIPAILTANGPVVAVSTKEDVVAATAISRAHSGNLWCFAPDGETHVPDGIAELRWSPLVGAEDWDTARGSARDMTTTLSGRGVRGGEHWKDRARSLLGPIFHYAARVGIGMEDVLAMVPAPGSWRVVIRWLETNNAALPASILSGVLSAGSEELGSIMSTAMRALSVYEGTGALAAARNPNFDPAAFVRGGVRQADTVYVTSTGRQQEAVAPLIVALLGRIREAVYAAHRAGNPTSTLFALDELYGLAPIPDLPAMLTDGGSQGLLIAGAIQDLALAKARWQDEADGFLTLFGNVVVFPGIRDSRTLDAVSKLIGDWDRPMVSQTYGGFGGTGGTTHSTHREAIHSPADISRGVAPENPDIVLVLSNNTFYEILATPYYRAAPWPQVLASYMVRAASGRVPEWMYWESERTGERAAVLDMLPYLPMPDLATWLDRLAGDRKRGVWARDLQSQVFPELRRLRQGQPRRAVWELAPGWSAPGPWSRLPSDWL